MLCSGLIDIYFTIWCQGVSVHTQGHFSVFSTVCLSKCQTCNSKKGVEGQESPLPLCCQVECDLYWHWEGVML